MTIRYRGSIMDQSAQPATPQPVYVVRTQVERAEAANATARWVAVGVSTVLLLTVVMAWLIPVVIAATAIGNRRRLRAAHAGRYHDEPIDVRDHRTATRCVGALLLLALAAPLMLAVRTGSWGVAAAGLAFAVAAVVLLPWRDLWVSSAV